MPNKCVAWGCSRGNEDGVTLHHFPKDVNLRQRWSAAVARYRKDWKGPSNASMLCSMHFQATCYEDSVVIMETVGMSSGQKRRLKKEAVPTLFPNQQDYKTGSLSWAEGSLHVAEDTTRHLPQKRQRSRVSILFNLLLDRSCISCSCHVCYVRLLMKCFKWKTTIPYAPNRNMILSKMK